MFNVYQVKFLQLASRITDEYWNSRQHGRECLLRDPNYTTSQTTSSISRLCTFFISTFAQVTWFNMDHHCAANDGRPSCRWEQKIFNGHVGHTILLAVILPKSQMYLSWSVGPSSFLDWDLKWAPALVQPFVFSPNRWTWNLCQPSANPVTPHFICLLLKVGGALHHPSPFSLHTLFFTIACWGSTPVQPTQGLLRWLWTMLEETLAQILNSFYEASITLGLNP